MSANRRIGEETGGCGVGKTFSPRLDSTVSFVLLEVCEHLEPSEPCVWFDWSLDFAVNIVEPIRCVCSVVFSPSDFFDSSHREVPEVP